MQGLSKAAKDMLTIIERYDWIADNGNLMFELDWSRRRVTSVGRALINRGLATYAPVDAAGFEGGVWEATEAGKRVHAESQSADSQGE